MDPIFSSEIADIAPLSMHLSDLLWMDEAQAQIISLSLTCKRSSLLWATFHWQPISNPFWNRQVGWSLPISSIGSRLVHPLTLHKNPNGAPRICAI